MQLIDPIFDFLTVTWEAAAQEAAFEERCFCMLDTGRIINRAAMPAGTPHGDRHADGVGYSVKEWFGFPKHDCSSPPRESVGILALAASPEITRHQDEQLPPEKTDLIVHVAIPDD